MSTEPSADQEIETESRADTIARWTAALSDIPNVGKRLGPVAERQAALPAVVEARARADTRSGDRVRTFAELDRMSDRIAASLRAGGVPAGARMVLAVPPGIDFVTLVFALLKARLIAVLIDPGMGRENLLQCLADVEPDGFIGPPRVQAIRTLLRRRFPKARFHVTCGRRYFWGGWTLASLRRDDRSSLPDEPCSLDDPAAIIFTTGSTGPPKGVFYRHRQFARQVEEIQTHYQLLPGSCDVAAFPLFGLFNALMGCTTIFPEMDYTRPADVEPSRIIDAVRRWKATRSFGSPAFWNRVATYCDEHDVDLTPLQTVYSAGAPVPVHVLERVLPRLEENGNLFTPYGATEALPVASIGAREVLSETARATRAGKGTCVGRRFPGIAWKVIEISDEPAATIDQVKEVPVGTIGELMVLGDVVTERYVTREEANALHKVADGDRTWHRMGDVGYLDDDDRFWFCGRKAHRVETAGGTMFTIPCEAVIASHSAIYRAALVGVGRPPRQRPVMIAEPWPDHWPDSESAERELLEELESLARAHPFPHPIERFFLMRRLPTDIRHNAKIFREQLARWAEERIGRP